MELPGRVFVLYVRSLSSVTWMGSVSHLYSERLPACPLACLPAELGMARQTQLPSHHGGGTVAVIAVCSPSIIARTGVCRYASQTSSSSSLAGSGSTFPERKLTAFS